MIYHLTDDRRDLYLITDPTTRELRYRELYYRELRSKQLLLDTYKETISLLQAVIDGDELGLDQAKEMLKQQGLAYI